MSSTTYVFGVSPFSARPADLGGLRRNVADLAGRLTLSRRVSLANPLANGLLTGANVPGSLAQRAHLAPARHHVTVGPPNGEAGYAAGPGGAPRGGTTWTRTA
jgi:hypothetical protein